jgi:hypothetical protein
LSTGGAIRPASATCDVPVAGRHARAVARPDNHRKAQAEHAALVGHGLLILDHHRDPLTGADVRDRRREEIRPLLLHERGALAGLLGLLVSGLRGTALADLALDHAVADAHRERVDRGALGEREDVDAFLPQGRRVLERLRDLGARDETGHANIDFGMHERRDERLARAVARAEEQRALLRLARLHRAQRRARFGGRSAARQEQRDRGEQCARDQPHAQGAQRSRQPIRDRYASSEVGPARDHRFAFRGSVSVLPFQGVRMAARGARAGEPPLDCGKKMAFVAVAGPSAARAVARVRSSR